MRDIGVTQAVHEKTWKSRCREFTKVFKLTIKDEQRFFKSKTALFLYRLPFIAGCINPERTALAHLSLYITEAFLFTKTPHFISITNHTPEDDSNIFSRVRPLMNYNGGNSKAIAHGTALLALIMLCGYDKSRNKDSLKGVYNPLNSGAWNFAEKKEELLSIITDNFCTEVDKELSVEKAMNIGWF
jgi:hypothetical protein